MGKGVAKNRKITAMIIAFVFLIIYVLLFVKYGFLFKKASVENARPIYRENSLYYNNLSRKNQYLYDVIKNAINNFDSFTEEIPYKYSSDEFNDVVKFIICDNPMLFYVNYDSSVMYTNDAYTKVELKYAVDKEDAVIMRKALENELDKIVSQVKRDSDFETELAIHDYLVQNCAYLSDDASENYLNNTAYGAIINRKSYCDGYALAFKELMNRCGLFSSTVCGNAKGLNHMWNLVFVDDNFYYVDVTWDDADSDMIFHGYLNVNEAEISKSHEISYRDFLPDCEDSTDYYHRAGLYMQNAEEMNTFVNSALRSSASSGKKYFEIMLVYEGASADLRSAFSAAVKSINNEGKYKFSDAFREHYCSEDKNKINIEVYYEDAK